jgi:predicted RNase H-like HicB family nuclease
MQVQEYTFYMTWDPEDRIWVTHVPDLNGLSTYGETREEAIAMTKEAIEGYIEAAIAQGIPLPQPSSHFEKIAVTIP